MCLNLGEENYNCQKIILKTIIQRKITNSIKVVILVNTIVQNKLIITFKEYIL